MKVLFFLPYSQEAAGCRYRVHQYVPFLQAHGIRCELRELITPPLYDILYRPGHRLKKAALFTGRALGRLRDLVDARDCDLFFIYRECFPFGPAVLERYLRGLGKPIVYDFDDAIYLPDPDPLKNLLRAPGKTPSIVHLADQVIVSNEHLRRLCLAYNRNVNIIPTSVDTEAQFTPRGYPPVLPPGDGRPVRLGWVGSHSTARYLERLRGALTRVAARHPIELLVVGAGRELEFPGVKTIQLPWSLAREPEDFRSLDIGLYPIDDELWELGKGAFKMIQYMSSAVPGVVSPVGMIPEFVRDGVNGLLARSEDEWVDRIGRLIEQPALRRSIAEAGRQTAVEKFSLTGNAPALLEVLRAAAERRPVRAPSSPTGASTRAVPAVPGPRAAVALALALGISLSMQGACRPREAPPPAPAAAATANPAPVPPPVAAAPAPTRDADVYFKVIEPHFERVSIYDGPEPFLRELERTPERARHLLTAHWCVSEISNGGFQQFFAGAAGVMAPESVAGLRALGLEDNARLLEKAIARLGKPYPRAADQRNRQLDLLNRKAARGQSPFSDVDEPFLRALRAHAGGFDGVAAAYARQS
jgi:glycosyltransferase involved in cell wall biosynthesis